MCAREEAARGLLWCAVVMAARQSVRSAAAAAVTCTPVYTRPHLLRRCRGAAFAQGQCAPQPGWWLCIWAHGPLPTRLTGRCWCCSQQLGRRGLCGGPCVRSVVQRHVVGCGCGCAVLAVLLRVFCCPGRPASTARTKQTFNLTARFENARLCSRESAPQAQATAQLAPCRFYDSSPPHCTAVLYINMHKEICFPPAVRIPVWIRSRSAVLSPAK